MSNELLLLTGMSGAGRSTVAHALEDSGWYVVDNLPPALVLGLVQTSDSPRIAVVVDVRLVGQAEHEHLRSVDRLPVAVRAGELLG